MIYESADYHNAVFVGYDDRRHCLAMHINEVQAARAPTKAMRKAAIPEYSFHWTGTDNAFYLFEAPIDMLSFISTAQGRIGRSHSYAAACSVSGIRVLFQMLKDNPNIQHGVSLHGQR